MSNGEGKRPITVGHRGASALAPENTLRAFDLALKYGLDMVELDVHLSRDEELMVIHDADLSRVAGLSTRVAELTALELAGVDVGGGQGISRLVDVIDWARGRIGLYVELKGPRTGAALAHLVRTGVTAGAEIIAGTFEPRLIEELMGEAPGVTRSVMFPAIPTGDMISVCRSLEATYAHPCFRPVERAMIDELHEAGLLVMTPHTNDPGEARQFAAIGVDVIASDDPSVLVGLARS